MGALINEVANATGNTTTTTIVATTGSQPTNFETLFDSKKELLSRILRSQDVTRFMSVTVQLASDKKLANCTPESLVDCFIGIAQYDLVPGIGGEAYVIGYKDKATLQIGYKGYKQLLYRAGWSVVAHPVYKCDNFIYRIEGAETISSLEPDFMARQEDNKEWVLNNLIGVYVAAKDDMDRKQYSFITRRVIEKLRLTSANQIYASQYTKQRDRERINNKQPIGIWEDWYEEMAIAKAVKKFSKSLPISDQRVKQVLHNDDQMEIGNNVNFEAEAQQQIKSTEVTSDNYTDAIMQLKAAVESLGFNSTGPTEKNGNYYIKATPLRDDANFSELMELGFLNIHGKIVMKVTHLM